MIPCSSCSVDNSITHTVQGTVTNAYRARFSSNNEEAIIKLIWSKTRTSPSLSVSINNNPVPINGIRGSYTSITFNSVIGICWDYSAAKYNLVPEPESDFYVVVIIDNEFSLLVGDKSVEFARSFCDREINNVAEFSLVSRTVQDVGEAIYSTKARFCEDGQEHDIEVNIKGELDMSLRVDNKRIFHVKRLRSSFRGNETFSVDGLVIDVMWDLYRWLFQEPAGCAVLTLRTRTGLGSRLWLELEGEKRNEAMCEGSSILIQVSQL